MGQVKIIKKATLWFLISCPFFRLLTMEEMKNFSDCSNFRQIPSGGNLINSTSSWTISGGLIKEIDVPEKEISCEKKRKMLKLLQKVI